MTQIWDWRARQMRPGNRYEPGNRAHPALAPMFGASFFQDVWGSMPRVAPWRPLEEADWLAVFAEIAAAHPELAAPDRPGTLCDAHKFHPGLGRLQEGFRAYFRCPVTTDLVRTDPAAEPGEEGHDAAHGFVLQLVGAGRWLLGPAAVPWPEDRFEHPVEGNHANRPHPVQAGQLLYLPPGVRHRLVVEGGPVVHLRVWVHGPRLHDLIEAAVDGQAARDVSIRSPVHARVSEDGVHWGVQRGRVAGALRQLADRLEARPRVLPGGTPVASMVEGPVEGEFAVERGRFVPTVAGSSDWLGVARAGAAVLVEGLPEVVGVYATGSVLRDGPAGSVKDLDLLVVLDRPPAEDGRHRVLAHLATVGGAHPPWDVRPVIRDQILAGQGSPSLQLVLAIDVELLAGEPLWPEPPAIDATLELGVTLFREARDRFAKVAELAASGEAPEGTTAWLQKRALRLGGIRALVQAGRYTRHPDGCVAWIDRLLPDLATLARVVRDELYTGRVDAPARERALNLGKALIRR